MSLIVETSSTHEPERRYALDVVLREFLGLPWQHVPADRSDVRITLSGQPGEIVLPDVLFRVCEDEWLKKPSMPQRPLAHWDTAGLEGPVTVVEARIPVIYGDAEPRLLRQDGSIRLPIDIFGSAFFMLSRYEELVIEDRDEHDRFPAWASLAYQEGFLERPIVDEYVEILWVAMQQLWPQLARKRREPRTFVTCDVDSALSFRGKWPRVVRRMGGDLLHRHSPARAWRTLNSAIGTAVGNLAADPDWHGLQWMMDVNERAGHPVAFYFIPETTDAKFDNPLPLEDPRSQALIKQMHERGHEIGLHPGYQTYQQPETMARSAWSLRQHMAQAGIDQSAIGGRMHYLRWRTPETMRAWEEAGMSYDSTLAYADHPGFRCGTCHEYPLYDLVARQPLRLRERPLIVMECSVIAKRYMGMGYSDDALELMLSYKETCRRFGGTFTLLWHNSHLGQDEDKQFYRALIG